MSVEEAIVGRQSIRAFQPDREVARETIENILEIAGRAPSGSNIQPWKVWVVTGAARDAIAEACHARHMSGDQGEREYNYYPVDWRDPYLARRRETGWGLYGLLGIEKGDREAMKRQHGRNFLFFDAPVGLFFTIERDLELGSWLDCGMFIQSVMLAARGEGLETCPQAAFCNYHDTVTTLLGVPADQQLICGMSLGYALPEAKVNRFRTTRIEVAEFTTFLETPATDD
ncbi:MAG: nitroreductase [Gammaproteobacteria bacterium]|nr:nitroreductase [Gammaproteobacteria bacterium]